METKTQKSNEINMLNSQKKANIVFLQILAIFFASLLFLVYASTTLYDKLLLIWPSIMGKLEAACGCSNHFTFSNHPYLFISLIFAGLAFLTFIYFTISKIKKISNSTKKFINSNLKYKKNRFSNNLKIVAAKLNLKDKITEIDSSDFTVFCYGLNPKICISQKFSEQLNEDELTTILLHEQCHLRNSEPLRIFLIKIVQRILCFIPGLNALINKYITLSELAADEWVLKTTNCKSSLASAFYKILDKKESNYSRPSLALPFFSTVIDARINKITNDKYVYSYKIFNTKLLLIIFFLSSSVISFNAFIYSSKSAIANHYSGHSCTVEQPQDSEQCQMTNNSIECSMNMTQVINNSSCEMEYKTES